MSTAIYVISDGSNPINRYKVGSHTGDYEKLITRYITAIPELKIHYFIETTKASDIESRFKIMYRDKRVVNIKGNYSEWYIMPLSDISEGINKLLNENYNMEIDQDKELIEKLEKEGIKLLDKELGINFRKPSDIPPDKDFDKYRELLKATNRVYKREQRKRDKNKVYTHENELQINISTQYVNNTGEQNALINNQVNVDTRTTYSRPMYNNQMITSHPLKHNNLLNNIIITPGFIMEVINLP